MDPNTANPNLSIHSPSASRRIRSLRPPAPSVVARRARPPHPSSRRSSAQLHCLHRPRPPLPPPKTASTVAQDCRRRSPVGAPAAGVQPFVRSPQLRLCVTPPLILIDSNQQFDLVSVTLLCRSCSDPQRRTSAWAGPTARMRCPATTSFPN